MNETEANDTVDWDDVAGQPLNAAGQTAPAVCFVVVFHPQTERIGELASCPASAAVLEFGRERPAFAAVDAGNSEGLGDRYVSREAFSMQAVSGGWRLSRHPGSSRLQVSGHEVAGDITLSDVQLEAGVIIGLARRVVLHCRLRRAPALPVHRPFPLNQLLGVSEAMQQLHAEVLRAAAAPDDVLLLGATGTGKERVAQAIHALSRRADGPWVAVNMAAIPVEIAAASLFGVRRGAYTGADSHRRGYFQQAAGGSLFLDEVGDTPEALQPLLLRALQERELQVVGGTAESVDLRVISATERDPAEASRFRTSLRHRLAAQEISLPKLAQRAEDIGLLAVARLNELAAQAGKPWNLGSATNLDVQHWARCFELFVAYEWPGNVRELQHAVAQVYHASRDVPVLPKSLSQRLLGGQNAALTAAEPQPEIPEGDADSLGSAPQVREAPGKRLVDLSDEEFLAAWKSANFEVARLARDLGVSRAAVYRRLGITEGCRLARDVPLSELFAALEACRGDLNSSAQRLAVSARGLESRLRSSGMRPTRDGYCAPYSLPG